MINSYVVISLILRIIAVILPILFVTPKQIREINILPYDYMEKRVGLFWLVIIWISVIISTIPYMYTRINTPMVFDFREMTSMAVSILETIGSLIWVLFYSFRGRR